AVPIRHAFRQPLRPNGRYGLKLPSDDRPDQVQRDPEPQNSLPSKAARHCTNRQSARTDLHELVFDIGVVDPPATRSSPDRAPRAANQLQRLPPTPIRPTNS